MKGTAYFAYLYEPKQHNFGAKLPSSYIQHQPALKRVKPLHPLLEIQEAYLSFMF